MIKELIRLANHLDKKGLKKEADYLDFVVRKYAEDLPEAAATATLKVPSGDVTYFYGMWQNPDSPGGLETKGTYATDGVSHWIYKHDLVTSTSVWENFSGTIPSNQQKIEGGALTMKQMDLDCLPGDRAAPCLEATMVPTGGRHMPERPPPSRTPATPGLPATER